MNKKIYNMNHIQLPTDYLEHTLGHNKNHGIRHINKLLDDTQRVPLGMLKSLGCVKWCFF